MVKLTACSLLLLLYFQSVELTYEVVEGCAEFKPDDEKDSVALTSFNEELLLKTFDNTVPLSTICPKSQCSLDPKGDAIWIARENFYKRYSVYSKDHVHNTLDGCFCNSATAEDLNSCLEQVRQDMTEYLQKHFNKDLAHIIENDKCQGFVTNCLNI